MQPLKITQALKAKTLELLQRAVDTAFHSVGSKELSISIKYKDILQPSEQDIPAKAQVNFTPTAYLKMRTLVQEHAQEIAWHGVVQCNGVSNYTILDVLVYPQLASATYVESDDDKYNGWLDSLDDDTINNLRFQGHSHVNMSVSPSGTDTANWKNLIEMPGLNDYYILAIANKKGELALWVCDLQNNIVYNPEDIICNIVYEDGTFKAWAAQTINEQVKPRYAYPVYTTNYSAPGASCLGRAALSSINKRPPSVQSKIQERFGI